ncbi:MAG: hypothetical protein C4525_15855 [Desulfarculus sp.]|jgi:hypothetical protein|nr:MAG: hypothetical protein C4525_15855 [Desulfarculus sp.]
MEIQKTWEKVKQPRDEATAGSPWFWLETYKEFQEGLICLLKELEKYTALAASLELESSPYEKEIGRLKRMIDWGEKEIAARERDSSGEITIIGVSYGSLRYLKAGLLFRVSQLLQKRSMVLREHKTVPGSLLETFNQKIQQIINLGETGVLNSLKPADVFFEIAPTQEQSATEIQVLPQISSYTTGQSSSFEVPIIDPTLRTRCLSILNAIDNDKAADQYDILIREISVILEDRVRQLSGYTGKLSGVQLFGEIMGKVPPKIKFSNDKDLQESAHLLFRGYSGFVRNEVMHGLVPSYTRERVLQLIGTVDYLLFLLSQAEIKR